MAQRKDSDAPLQLVRRRTIVSGLIVLVFLGMISTILISIYGDVKFGESYFVGALVGILNGIIGFLTIEKFIDKPTLAFLRGVFLGMGIRLVLLLGIFIILIKLAHMGIAGLVTGLLIFYFTMTTLEVIFLNKRVSLKKSTVESP